MGKKSVELTQEKFVSAFPPDRVYRGEIQAQNYIEQIRASLAQYGRTATIEELIFVHVHNSNPAVHPLVELVDDKPLEPTAYKSLIANR